MDDKRPRRRDFGLAALGVCVGLLLPARRVCADAHLPPPRSPTLLRIRESRKLRVGMCPGVSPFILAEAEADELLRLAGQEKTQKRRADDGRMVAGLDVDLAAFTAQGLGVELEIALCDKFEDLFLTLGKDQVDVVLSGVSRTLARAAALSFSAPYLVSGQEVLTREPARFASLKEVNVARVRVGVEEGTTGESFARRTLPLARLSRYVRPDDLFRALEGKQIDIAVADGLLGRDAVLRHLVGGPLSSVENRRFTSEQIAFATRQGDPDFTEYLSLVVHDLKVSGHFHLLAHRYNLWLRTER